MENINKIIGKILYSLLFVAVLPFLLILWTRNTSWLISLPVPIALWPAYIIVSAGIILVISGILNLWVFGKGLPMNAFPPQHFVRKGIYGYMKHPIYAGTILLCFGISAIAGSSSGLWLVSPLFSIMVTAYVAGFENERTVAVFGKQDYRPFFSLPLEENLPPSFYERISSYVTGFIPWVIAYETFILAGAPADAITTNFPFEKELPVIELTGLFYISIYLFAFILPFIIKTKTQLRRFIADMWFVSIIAGLIYFAFPFITEQRDFIPETAIGRFILLDRSFDGVTASFPSFHVIWAFVTARYFSASIPRFSLIWYLVAILISISCITTGNHSISDVIAGFLVFVASLYRQTLWDLIRQQAETLANSWYEWRWGPVRLINHGFYGGAAGFAGLLISGCFLGREYALTGFLVFTCVIIGSGLWAQIIEGSSKLLRPFGYYGGLIGGIISCVALSLIMSINIYFLLASFAMAAPWVQAIGRLRCLVQGCCHGKPSDERTGIRFIHPFSRVNKISGLKGVPLHPTQIYSIACNLVSGLVLIRLYSLRMPAVFIIGLYLIMNGLGRFVEESLRGEAQTPYWAGMRIYQWIALLNIFLGALFTTIHDTTTIHFQFNIESLYLAIVMGFMVMFASGVDFPESRKRFARLTSN
jgi:membrane-associated phospholipid phosphatase/protein-S-isoprenylcysteine O-methyltransferase Ste14